MMKRRKFKSIAPVEPEIKTDLVVPSVVQLFDDGWRIALFVAKGSKYLKLIVMSSKSIKITKVRVTEMSQIKNTGELINIREAATKFLEVGRRVGMTKAAEEALNGFI